MPSTTTRFHAPPVCECGKPGIAQDGWYVCANFGCDQAGQSMRPVDPALAIATSPIGVPGDFTRDGIGLWTGNIPGGLFAYAAWRLDGKVAAGSAQAEPLVAVCIHTPSGCLTLTFTPAGDLRAVSGPEALTAQWPQILHDYRALIGR